MDIAANREVGKILYSLIRNRMLAAGLHIPHIATGNLGQTLNICITTMGNAICKLQSSDTENLGKFDIDAPWVQTALRFDPHSMLMMQTVTAMTFFSLQEPDSESGLGVIPFTNDYFIRSGFAPMDDEEMNRLRERLRTLQAMQQAPGTLGAAGNALKQSALRPFKSLFVVRNSPGSKRRRTFTTAVEDRCVRVEELKALADRKAEASLLGELIAKELRASHAPDAQKEIDMFWREFDLFFGCTQLMTN